MTKPVATAHNIEANSHLNIEEYSQNGRPDSKAAQIVDSNCNPESADISVKQSVKSKEKRIKGRKNSQGSQDKGELPDGIALINEKKLVKKASSKQSVTKKISD